MPRDALGVVTLVVGNPVVNGTAISADVHNQTVADLASMIEDSLSRSGKGGMDSPMQYADGTSATPSITFFSDPNTGIFLHAADELGLAAGASESLVARAAGVTIPGTLTQTGVATFAAAPVLSAGITGIRKADFPAVGQVISPNSNAASIDGAGSTNWEDIVTCTALTTSGRPVLVALQAADADANSPRIYGVVSAANGTYAIRIVRETLGADTVVAHHTNNSQTQTSTNTDIAPYLTQIDLGAAAGIHTYRLQAKVTTATTIVYLTYLRLVAYEL